MKTKRDVRALVRKRAGKHAVIILNKVDKMLKRGVAREKIESVLTEELIPAHVLCRAAQGRCGYPQSQPRSRSQLRDHYRTVLREVEQGTTGHP